MASEIVDDQGGILSEQDHMRDMDRLEMEVVRIVRPFASVARVTGRITPTDPAAWAPANLAIRVEVETPEGHRPISRVYTVRSFDPKRLEIEIDFVIHEDDSPAMRWLQASGPGTRVWLTGPRQHFIPNHARRAAVFADETAIPAVYAILKAWPAGAPGHVWIETSDRAAFDELPDVPGVERTLILRDAPAGTAQYLLPLAQALQGDWTIWAAGERQEMREIRSHFRSAGMDREDVRVFGYWRHGVSSSEIDRQRLTEYAALRDKGLKMEEMRDVDLPV